MTLELIMHKLPMIGVLFVIISVILAGVAQVFEDTDIEDYLWVSFGVFIIMTILSFLAWAFLYILYIY